MPGLTNYGFGTKTNWRRWQWNRIKERVSIPAPQAKIIYMPGPYDHDIVEAQRRGFVSSNMLAVESDKRSAAEYRLLGRLTVHADILDVVASLPETDLQDVVCMDFCSGLEDEYLSFISYAAVGHPALIRTVWSCNFLRGRDRSSNSYRDAVKDFSVSLGASEKHRGAIWFSAYMAHLVNCYNDYGVVVDDRLFRWLLGRSRPALSSYKSDCGQWFDSVVFRNPLFSEIGGEIVRIENSREHEEKHRRSLSKIRGSRLDVVRKVAAVKAHITRRKTCRE